MDMSITKHSDDFATAGQIKPEDVAAIAKAGFKSIINNRPDGEGGVEQALSSEIAEAASVVGLEYYYIPVVSGQYSETQITAMADALQVASAPVFCFCRTGARSTQLYALAQRHQA